MDKQGLYNKFYVYERNERDQIGAIVSDFTFTLRPERDPLAAAALLFYADGVMAATGNTSPLLAEVEVFLKEKPNLDGNGTMYDAGVKLYNNIVNGICPPDE